MVATHSTMLDIGTKAPDFSLVDIGGEVVSLENYQGKPLLMAFICNHCPYVVHICNAFVKLSSWSKEKEYQLLLSIQMMLIHIQKIALIKC